jgi:predicted nucleic acid binding AN1-type Zn finger protein
MHAAPRKRWMEVKGSERLYLKDITKYENNCQINKRSSKLANNMNNKGNI